MSGSHIPSPSTAPPLRLIALELTRRCVLSCRTCRASAIGAGQADADELTGDEWRRLIDSIASFARPMVILTGGEPLLRPDVYALAAHAAGRGLRVVLATCGALLDDASAKRLIDSGVSAISISLDGATAASHDAIRGQEGAFAAAMRGIESAKRAGLAFQINTTVTRDNRDELPAILELAARLGAKTFNPFLFVPAGRGRRLADLTLSAAEYEQVLSWLAERQDRSGIPIRVTCAPHYHRILRQQGKTPAGATSARQGCLGGQSFAFISHCGKVQACGFLEVECGDVRQAGYDFETIWRTSPVFVALRDPARYRGRCGACEFHAVCGGCRGRAMAASGDYLGEEPLCLHQPRRGPGAPADEAAALDEKDKELLWAVQTQFPIAARPFDLLGQRLGIGPQDVLSRLRCLRERGFIRRIGAVFDSRRLGYVSTLVAATVPETRLAEVAGIISAAPGVTHNYSRRHRYNLWFTLTAPSQQEIDATLADLQRRIGLEDMHSLPSEKVYKIQAVFVPPGLAVSKEPTAAEVVPASPAAATALDETQRKVVQLLGGDLPLVERPFDEAARSVGWTAEQLTRQLEAWRAEGILRRIAALVSHRRLGYVANGMAVFRVPPDRIDDVGAAMARQPAVSHCYRRRPFAGFNNYNLFAMIHGQSADEVRRLADRLAAEAAVADHDVLFTEREFTKTSPVYFI
jgi:radical SAM protein with 4Fe4S-binding SPASM domain